MCYYGIDVSEYACWCYGYERVDLVVWELVCCYDLVVC